jgi:hypothetical protein
MVDQPLALSDANGASGGITGFIHAMMNADFSFLQVWLVQMGQDPVRAAWWLILHGGWIVFVIIGFYGARALWLDWRQTLSAKKKKFILLAIDVPRESEQTVKAVENLFAHLAGAHSPASFMEKWIDGKYQDAISVEVISIEGHVQYLIHCIAGLRDLIEASIYAQYPSAEITEVEDYANTVPLKYPDEAYDCFGTELTNVKTDVYPLKTYVDFEHTLTGEFKDPLAALLEAFSRLGPGEQAWYQIITIPIDQVEFSKKAAKEVIKLKGEKEPAPKKTTVERILETPLSFLNSAAEVAFGGGLPVAEKKEDKTMKMLMMTPGERNRMEALERKASKIQYKCKIRFMYIAKKEVFSKGKIVQSFIGSIKQFNTNDLQALKPDGKKVGVNGTLLFFKERRNNRRKRALINAYKSRSGGVGLQPFFLGVDELASLWHLVTKDVKAPQLKKTEAKKVEPPMNIPFG